MHEKNALLSFAGLCVKRTKRGLFIPERGFVYSITVIGELIYSASSNGTIKEWNNFTCLGSVLAHNSEIRALSSLAIVILVASQDIVNWAQFSPIFIRSSSSSMDRHDVRAVQIDDKRFGQKKKKEDHRAALFPSIHLPQDHEGRWCD